MFFLMSLSCNKNKKSTTKYVVNKESSSCVCRVENPESRPQHGNKILGPFDTKEEAIKAMCENVDPTMNDKTKCWDTPGVICKDESELAGDNNINSLLYDHYELIRNLEQHKSMDCWATALTIMYSWKHSDNLIKIESVLKGYGDIYSVLFETNAGISQEMEEQLYKHVGLTVIKGVNPLIKTWYNLLKNSGPLSITVDADPPNGTIHALVVNGIKGDGTPNKTDIYYVDPADGLEHKVVFSKFIKLYEGSASWPLQIIHW